MPATTVLTEDAAVISEDDAGERRFSWAAAFAGAICAAAVDLFLLILGSGIGLSLYSVPEVVNGHLPGFLTMGAIYFFAAQAFAFAVGGYVVGRLIGPAAETDREEEFRSGAHGFAVWSLGVLATAAVLGLYGLSLASGASSAMTNAAAGNNGPLTPAATAYWTDVLFRPQNPEQASLAWKRFAQADTSATDAQPAPDTNAQPAPDTAAQPAPTDDESATPVQQSGPPAATNTAPRYGVSSPSSPATGGATLTPSGSEQAGVPAGAAPPVNLAADKAEVGRILDVGMANGGSLTLADRTRIAALVVRDADVTEDVANSRISNVQTRIRNSEMQTAETARVVARNASLWIAFTLLFGLVVAVFSAIAARHMDDRVTFGFAE